MVDACLVRTGAERRAVEEGLPDPEGAESEQRDGADTGGSAHAVSFWRLTARIYSSVAFECRSERVHFTCLSDILHLTRYWRLCQTQTLRLSC